jgi:hypothetical protein
MSSTENSPQLNTHQSDKPKVNWDAVNRALLNDQRAQWLPRAPKGGLRAIFISALGGTASVACATEGGPTTPQAVATAVSPATEAPRATFTPTLAPTETIAAIAATSTPTRTETRTPSDTPTTISTSTPESTATPEPQSTPKIMEFNFTNSTDGWTTATDNWYKTFKIKPATILGESGEQTQVLEVTTNLNGADPEFNHTELRVDLDNDKAVPENAPGQGPYDLEGKTCTFKAFFPESFPANSSSIQVFARDGLNRNQYTSLGDLKALGDLRNKWVTFTLRIGLSEARDTDKNFNAKDVHVLGMRIVAGEDVPKGNYTFYIDQVTCEQPNP